MNSTPNTDGFIYIVTLRAVTATLRDLHSGYQIGTACAGSNPAVRGVSNAADVPEWLRGLTRILR